MKLFIASDLHLEFADWQPDSISDSADVIVLAGDIHKGDKGIYWARATWPNHPIIYVAGNHEYYRNDRDDVEKQLRKAADETGVNYLQNNEVIIDGVRFLGCTLWTDFQLFGPDSRLQAMEACKTIMNDFRAIREGDKPFSPPDAEWLFNESYQWMDLKLGEPFNGKTVVVTHHLPSSQLVAPAYADNIGSAAFASNADALLGRSDLWVAGHTHTSFDMEIQGTRVVVNPRGYSTYSKPVENPEFRNILIVDI